MAIPPLIRLGRRLLTDEKFPDPVVPADLHLIKAVHADADGTVPCIYCGTRLPIAQASMIGSDGFSCGPCSARASMAAAAHSQMPAETGLRSFPWLLVGIVAVLIVTVIIVALG